MQQLNMGVQFKPGSPTCLRAKFMNVRFKGTKMQSFQIDRFNKMRRTVARIEQRAEQKR